MCGRYVSPDQAALEREWRIDRRSWPGTIRQVFNVSPTTTVPFVVLGDDGIPEVRAARWGLIPHWWKKEAPPTLTFNARSEEAAQKPMWRESMRAFRCLMPAVGWYEWNEHEPARSASGRPCNQPYFIHPTHGGLIAFAGLWSQWVAPNGAVITSCALLSTEASPSITAIHHRMPVVLPREHYEIWLNPASKAEDVRQVLGQPVTEFEGYRVSTHVNNARNEGPELVDPIPDSGIRGLF